MHFLTSAIYGFILFVFVLSELYWTDRIVFLSCYLNDSGALYVFEREKYS